MERNQENYKTHDLYRTTDSVIYQIVHPNMQLGAADIFSIKSALLLNGH
jgi:hypothetical protein